MFSVFNRSLIARTFPCKFVTSVSIQAPIVTLIAGRTPSSQFPTTSIFTQSMRFMNRNARRPKKANHGKRPCCNARRRAKIGAIQSRAHKEKIFGFWS